MITLETYFCIAFPMHFRKWAKKEKVFMLIIGLIIFDGLHHMALPILRVTVKFGVCLDSLNMYTMITKNGTFYIFYEKVYFYINSVAVIVLPNLLMILLSFLIAFQLKNKNMGQNFSQRRRCVVRITITTTVCYIILETPNLIMFFTAAIRGSAIENNESLCFVSVVTNFLAMLNSVVPFFVYVSFNGTFRELLILQLAPVFGIPIPERNNRNGYDTIEISRSRTVSNAHLCTRRSYCSTAPTMEGRLSCVRQL